MSVERADRLARDLAASGPRTIADFGCGWGQLMFRVVENAPDATAVGYEIYRPDVIRGRAEATDDIVINSGAHQAFGAVPEALDALRKLVNPGGRLLFATGFWERIPTDADLATMWPDMTADELSPLADLVDQAIASGFRPLRIETSTPAEWEQFESGIAEGAEEWLLANIDHPQADAVRAKLDASRGYWLRGHRGFMGYAFLTLGVPR